MKITVFASMKTWLDIFLDSPLRRPIPGLILHSRVPKVTPHYDKRGLFPTPQETHTHTSVRTETHTHTHTHTSVRTETHTYTHTYTSVRTETHTHTHTYTSVRTYVQTCSRVERSISGYLAKGYFILDMYNNPLVLRRCNPYVDLFTIRIH